MRTFFIAVLAIAMLIIAVNVSIWTYMALTTPPVYEYDYTLPSIEMESTYEIPVMQET